MAKQEIKVELLLGRRVFSLNGRSIGRLEEIEVELKRGRCFVTEFHVGKYALLDRLAAWHLARAVMKHLRGKKKTSGYRIAWDQLELSDPARPRLTCAVSDLRPM